MHTLASICKNWGIGLTGGIASGKSTIARILSEQNWLVLDADTLSRELVAPGSEGFREVVEKFGATVLGPDGQLDRGAMRGIIFHDPSKRQLLESIIHPRLGEATERELRKAGFFEKPSLWFYEASLIFERNRGSDFREVWLAYCPPELQRQRLLQRDSCTVEQAEAILKAQMDPKLKLAHAQEVIDTDCSLIELHQRIDQLLTRCFGSPHGSYTRS